MKSNIKLKIFLQRVITFVVTLLFFNFSYAQNRTGFEEVRDSLKRTDLTNTIRLGLLYKASAYASSPREALSFGDALLELAIQENDIAFQASAYLVIGAAHRQLGDLDAALEYHFKGADISGKNQLEDRVAQFYTEISTSYLTNDDIENALLFNQRAIQILRGLNDVRTLSITLLNTGYHYYNAGEYDSAMQYYEEAEPLFDEIGLEIGKAYTIGNRALIHWKRGDLVRAANDLHDAINRLEPLGDSYGMADYYNQLGNVYQDSEDIRKAIAALEKGIEMAMAEGLKEQIRDASQLLSQLYEDERALDQALYYQKQYIAYKDSIQDEATTKKLADIRTEYEVGQKQAEIDLLSEQKRNSQLLSVGLAVILLLIGIFLSLGWRSYQVRKRLNEVLVVQKEQLKEQKSELESLNKTKDKFFSIISHDLRGPVSAFLGFSQLAKMYIERDQTKSLISLTTEMEKAATSVSSLLDNLLNWSMQQQGHITIKPGPVDVSGLVQELTNMFAPLAQEKNITLSSQIEENLTVWGDKNSVEAVLRNLLNNALKFTSEGSIRIEGVSIEGQAKISIADTGVGIPKEKLDELFTFQAGSTYGTSGEKGVGLGLQLVLEFINLNKGSIQVESTPGVGSNFEVTLPTTA